MTLAFHLNGHPVEVEPAGSLLDVLREQLGVRSAKDGCSPQGQCGCCTVWIDGQPRVACVTPAGRVAGRQVTTLEALPDADRWADCFVEHGGSQCGFCTPGIIMRAAALPPERRCDRAAVGQALLAHMCRCTGWQPIVDSIVGFDSPADRAPGGGPPVAADRRRSARRATLEGGTPQAVGRDVALGEGGFAADTSPRDALVAVRAPSGEWVVGESLAEARARSGKVQGRRTTAPIGWPIELPAGVLESGGFVRHLATTWVEPAYLETDASWCEPGGTPASAHGNGGAFGAKRSGVYESAARELADRYGRPVRVVASREDVVRFGPKRPPVAAAVRADGSGVIHIARTPGVAELIAGFAPEWEVVERDVVGPPTSISIRGAGWAEIAVLRASLDEPQVRSVRSPAGAVASATIDSSGTAHVRVECGDVLDPVVLRSYCVGAAHMALGWVRSEGLSLDADGAPADLTIRSFGVLRAVDTPPIEVELVAADREPVNGSEAVLAAVACAAWEALGFAPRWPAR